VQDRLRERRLTLAVDIAAGVGPFVGDQKRIRQVLFNLLSNAVLYSEPDGRIDVTCVAEAEQIRIAVADKGRGIPAARVVQVFDRFVELHGGSVAIDSKEGVGTTVICRFPRLPSAPVARRRAGP